MLQFISISTDSYLLLLLHFKFEIWITRMWRELATKEWSSSLLVLFYWILLLQAVASALQSSDPKPVRLYLNENCIWQRLLLGNTCTSRTRVMNQAYYVVLTIARRFEILQITRISHNWIAAFQPTKYIQDSTPKQKINSVEVTKSK